jgi:hypothetical protein
MLKKQNTEQGKPTHYIKVDTWKPDKSKSNNSQVSNDKDSTKEIGGTDSLPF